MMHKYIILFSTCHGKCNTCNEFNINKFSYLIDGEGRFLKSFMFRWLKFKKYFMSFNKKKYKELFKKREFSLIDDPYNTEIKKYSILGNKIKKRENFNRWEKEYKKKVRTGLVNFGDTSKMKKSVFKK